MTGWSGRLLLALGATAGALAVCVALPLVDPRCGAWPDAAAMLRTCGAASSAISQDAARVGLILAAILTIVAGLVARETLIHHRVSARLRRAARPAVVADHRVGLIPGVGAAVVAGIRQPRTYCSEDLLTLLDADELLALLLHERHHELTHAPAKLVILAAVSPLVGLTAPGSAWLERRRAGIEIEADEHALRGGASRPALASAILKLAEARPATSLAGFSSANDLRVRALLEEAHPARSRLRLLPAAIGAATVLVTVCTALSLP